MDMGGDAQGSPAPPWPSSRVTALCTQTEAEPQARMLLTQEAGRRSQPGRKPATSRPPWQEDGSPSGGLHAPLPVHLVTCSRWAVLTGREDARWINWLPSPSPPSPPFRKDQLFKFEPRPLRTPPPEVRGWGWDWRALRLVVLCTVWTPVWGKVRAPQPHGSSLFILESAGENYPGLSDTSCQRIS